MGLDRLIKGRPKMAPEVLRRAKPLRNPAVTSESEAGVVTLRGPAVMRGLLGKLIGKTATETPTKAYELEEIGAFVWEQIDGKRTFESLAKLLQNKYRMNRFEAEASLAAFLQMLNERGLITLLVKEKK